MTACCNNCLVTCETEAQEHSQKVEASQMCWMHLLPLGECSCTLTECAPECTITDTYQHPVDN